jgi:hypothetical protein
MVTNKVQDFEGESELYDVYGLRVFNVLSLNQV